jgi:hypothetical protein
MRKLTGIAFGVLSLLVPVLAIACPAAARTSACCGSSLGEYASTFGIGLLAGVGSVALESALRKKKRS